MDLTRLELSPERLRQIQHLVEEIRRRQAVYPLPKPPQRQRRTRQYSGGRPNPQWQPMRYRNRRRG